VFLINFELTLKRCESSVPRVSGFRPASLVVPALGRNALWLTLKANLYFFPDDKVIPMNRYVRCVTMTWLLGMGVGLPFAHAQQSANAEPQVPSSTAQGAREVVPALPVPRLVKFAGAFKDEQGKPRSGIVGVTFAIYKDQEGGAALWLETQNVQLDEQGHYSVLLGSTKNEGLPLELFSAGEPRWLGVQVNLPGEVEQARVLLVSVPYALKAADAENLGGKPASSYALATGDIGTGIDSGGAGGSAGSKPGSGKKSAKAAATPATVSGTMNFIPVFTDNTGSLGNSVMVQGSNGVGVLQGPTSNSTVQLDVNGGIRGTGLATGGRNTTPDAINTNSLFLNGSNAMAVIGASNAAFTPGVLFTKLSFFAGNGNATAERMTVDGPTGNVGIGTTTPGAKLDLRGNVNVVAATSGVTGVSVQATDLTTANTAIYGLADGASGTGVIGEAENGNLAIGVWGISSSGVAGQFSGNVNVTGSLSKSGGSFKIDHPIDPANKYLYHSFVESPDMKNIYDGVVKLDAQGQAVVQLPAWFGALNREFRYQLACIGGFAPVYIAEEISENRFKISGGKPGMKVSWMVTGIRQDAWANAHRIAVEEDKPMQERGYYLHPELYGQPPSNSTDRARHRQIEKR